jgi:hypothetical protein
MIFFLVNSLRTALNESQAQVAARRRKGSRDPMIFKLAMILANDEEMNPLHLDTSKYIMVWAAAKAANKIRKLVALRRRGESLMLKMAVTWDKGEKTMAKIARTLTSTAAW